MSKHVTVHLIIKGRVQGVGYRAWITSTARKLGLVGWVRNLATGDVEALAHGPESAVRQLVIACQAGPALARVTAVDSENVEAPQPAPSGFEQLSTR
jgi:acylphosphatase